MVKREKSGLCTGYPSSRYGSAKDQTYFFPVISVLFRASMVIPHLTMDEKNGKVDDVKVGDGRGEPCRKTPCPAVITQTTHQRD
jgi:hypothetical protein